MLGVTIIIKGVAAYRKFGQSLNFNEPKFLMNFRLHPRFKVAAMPLIIIRF